MVHTRNKKYREGTEEWNRTYGGSNSDRGYSGEVTLDDGYSASVEACFPADMQWGCYLISSPGAEAWHLYGFEVFGTYIVDWDAGIDLDWIGSAPEG